MVASIDTRFDRLTATQVTVEDTSGRDADHIPLAFPQDADQKMARVNGVEAAGVYTKRKALRNAVSDEWTPVLDPATLAAAPALGLATGLLVGLYPSWRASRIQPVEALRH